MNSKFLYFKVIIASFLLLFASCENKKQRSVYIDFESEPTSSLNSTEVPFKEVGGVKLVHVKVNGVGWDMIFDTGCSGTLLSLSEARYLATKGLLLEEDNLGVAHSRIADGSIVENTVVNLRQVSIITNDGGTIDCYNVKATVSNNINAPLLLGNAVLKEVAYDYTIDEANSVILFNVK